MPFFAVILPVVILFCGLAIDVGTLQLRKIQVQAAADAAAFGAELEAERGTNNYANAALQDAAANGFTNGVNGVSIALSLPTSGGTFNGRWDTGRITISQAVHTLFLGALNGGVSQVSASSVALITPCIYSLGTANLVTYPFYAASAGAYSSCPVYVNPAMEIDGFATLNSGGANITGSAGTSATPGYIALPPRYGAETLPDPLSALSIPVFSGVCNYTNYALSGSSATLSPGTYCKGLALTNSTVFLNPGLYTITGSAPWKNSTVTGVGVTLFFTQGGGGGYGGLVLTSNTAVNISAPVTNAAGGIPTIKLLADRNWIPTQSQDFQCIFSSFTGDGIIYLPKAGLYLWTCGTITGPNYSNLVVDNVYFYQTTLRPLQNFSNIPGGNPLRPLGGLVQ